MPFKISVTDSQIRINVGEATGGTDPNSEGMQKLAKRVDRIVKEKDPKAWAMFVNKEGEPLVLGATIPDDEIRRKCVTVLESALNPPKLI